MQTLAEYSAFLADIREKTGLTMLVPDDDGLVSVTVDDKYNLNLQFVAASGKILCFVAVYALPLTTPAEVYRRLLVAGLFGKETAGGYFSLEDASNTLLYNYLLDGDYCAKYPEEFVDTLEKIVQLCEQWADLIETMLKAEDEVEPHKITGEQFFA